MAKAAAPTTEPVPEPAAVVWTGADALRAELRPVDELKLHPRNPWRGDVASIAKSLARFGQVRPLLLDAADNRTVVAGNHTLMAAKSLGWTHVAAIPNTFADEAEALAYLLADNRLAEVGDYERVELTALLAELEERQRWDGTGYTSRDLEDLRRLEELRNAPPELPPPPDEPGLPPAAPPALREVVLMFIPAQRDEFGGYLRVLWKEYGTEGVSETVLRALHEEADLLRVEDSDGS